MRLAATDRRERPLASYLFGDALRGEGVSAPRPAGQSGGFTPPAGRHVLLAACQPSELAKEIAAEGGARGAFSHALLATLEAAQGPLTYLEVRERTRLRVQHLVAEQLPLLEVNPEYPEAVRETFLDGATAEPAPLTAFYDGAWRLNAGSLHGLPSLSGEEGARVALFPEGASAEALREPRGALTEALVREVGAQTSLLEPAEVAKLDPARLYQAVVVDLPLARLPVRFEGWDEGVQAAREALATALDGKPSRFVREETAAPEYRLIAATNGYTVARAADDRPLLGPISRPTLEQAAREAVGQLEHIARWTATSLLDNPGSRIPPDAVKLRLRVGGKTHEDESVTLHYGAAGGEPTFDLALHNTTAERLYCALLALFESYAVAPVFSDWLEPGAPFPLNGGKPLTANVPQPLWEAGVTERRDLLKLIVSREPFDAHRLQQGPLAEYRAARGARGALGSLERLMHKVATREVSWGEGSRRYDDWTSKAVTLTVVRPREGRPVPSAGEGLALHAGVTLGPHPNLKATARLSTFSELSRDLRGSPYRSAALPDVLRHDPFSQPLGFSAPRGADPGLSVLELSDVENPAVVTPETPLTLTLEEGLEPGETVLPLAFDGEHYLPLGFSRTVPRAGTRAAGTKTEIVLERLPDPTPNLKSLFGSLRILFQKFRATFTGEAFAYPVLAAAEVSGAAGDDRVSYHQEVAEVKARVEAAQRILLFVHGIIGDTLGMVPSVRLARVSSGAPLCEHFDLVLTFDYESVHTPIRENARLLQERLAAVGLGAGHGKQLDVVAHSMGGLVSRWLIEQLGGDAVVSRLVMLGTPNAGSPWPGVQDWATSMLGVGLNGLSQLHWSAAVIAKLVALAGTALETVDTALDEMNPASDFLRALAKSPDPKLAYTVLAGNTSVLKSDDTERLLAKLKLRTYAALTQFLFKEANDAAVSVASIHSLDMKRQPKPKGVTVASDHVSYFRTPDALEQLAKALE